MKRGGQSLHQFIMREAASTGQIKRKLTDVQRQMLARYEGYGGYPTSQSFGRASTLDVLVREGLVRKSGGLGVVEVEITTSGRAALQEQPREALATTERQGG